MQDADLILVMDGGAHCRLRHARGAAQDLSEIYREVYESQTNGGDDECLIVNPHADPTRRDGGPAALGRTVKKLFSYYPVLAPVTFVCILFSSIVSSVPSLFTQNIIQIIEKWYISRDWAAAKAEIVPYLTLLVVLYALSILSMTVYTQLMAYMTQGFLHKLRCEMFGGMQKLPIRYFDSHQHGDIMSHYTNDIDTLRQLVSQALPALIQSGAIVLVVFSHHALLQPLADAGAGARHRAHGRGHEEDRRRQREILRPPAEGRRLAPRASFRR